MSGAKRIELIDRLARLDAITRGQVLRSLTGSMAIHRRRRS
jgi:hypothetical protein